jgi:hypothetical protein
MHRFKITICDLRNRSGPDRKYMPYAFTEQGVAMLSSVLNSDRAIDVKYSDHAGVRQASGDDSLS